MRSLSIYPKFFFSLICATLISVQIEKSWSLTETLTSQVEAYHSNRPITCHMIKISRLSVMPIDKAMRKEENCHDKSNENKKTNE